MYPATGFTKGQLIDFYTRAAPALLPHLRGRPLTLKRYPNGVDDKFFYEKNCPSHRPDWVRTARVDEIDYCLCDDLPTLVWMANLADLELHPSLSLAEEIERPTVMAFDLDPGEPAGIMECREVALLLRDTLERIGLECFPKTSGSKGIQVYAPLNAEGVTYDQTKPLSQALARHLEGQHPKLIVSQQKKELRKGKVLIDWSQNDEHKTTVSVYSLRAREQPTVSTPLTWDELEAAEGPDDLSFTADEVLERVAEHGDLFAPVRELRQQLPDL
jgi:bifunctional non-homologous end joining protein LigD